MSTLLSGNALPVSATRRSRVTLAVLLACPLVVIATAPSAFAQSTGTTAAEDLQEIVVTGRRAASLGVVTEQNAAKSRITITGDALSNYIPGQTFLESLNQVPGLVFTNTDPYGSSGGNLRLRGFDGARVSLTFDGIPLNDTGNYAIYTNQQIDAELIEAVDVNLGTTDVDSPTASATGGTINVIPAGAYGSNHQGGDARTHGAIVNFSAGLHVPDDVVYAVTKAIWENLPELQETAVWMPSTVTKEGGLALIAGRLHPGALRYYQEAGWAIPEATVFQK